MTSKEKALELVDKYNNQLQRDMTCIVYMESAKQCALICVEEISEVCKELPVGCIYEGTKDYYLKVKEELLKL
jgi:hypothetical protein